MKTLFSCCIALSYLMISIIPAQAQQQIDPCGFERAVDHMEDQHPGYEDAIDYTIQKAKAKANSRGASNDSILQIPVVVHIVHENQTENLPDSLIYNQIEVLNRSFRRNNPDTTDTRAVFDTLAGDARIEFYLADENPSGNPTTGITRTQTTKSSFFNFTGGTQSIDEIKSDADGGKSPWPTNEYLNMWVGDVGGAVLGFAYPPVGAPDSMWSSGQLPNDSSVSGVVVHYEAFGRNNPLTSGPQLGRADEGGTAVHEVGHYLGLRHISGDGDCTADDYIDDTPSQNGQGGGLLGGGHHQTCAYGANTCQDSPIAYPDMFENYMDYAPDSCTNLFTKDQIALMRTMVLEERSELYETKGNDSTVTSSSNEKPDVKNERTFGSQLTIAPNPSNGDVKIRADFQQPRNVTFEIYNNMGKRVQKRTLVDSESLKQNVGLSNQPNGIYILKLRSGDQIHTEKLILQ